MPTSSVRAALRALSLLKLPAVSGSQARRILIPAASFLKPVMEIQETQIVFNYNVDKSFKEWATGSPTDECVICTVDTAQSALNLVAAGVGIAFIPDKCVQEHPAICFVPLKNWHQALYMCIYYDKWLEPPVWDFVELLVRSLREAG